MATRFGYAQLLYSPGLDDYGVPFCWSLEREHLGIPSKTYYHLTCPGAARR